MTSFTTVTFQYHQSAVIAWNVKSVTWRG